MEKLSQIQQTLDQAKAEAEKFYNKGNNAAGVRLRKCLQDIKSIASDLRKETIEIAKKG